MIATREQVIEAISNFYKDKEYEADALIAMAQTFGFELIQGKSQLYATCNRCSKRLMNHTYGMGSLSERIAEHGCRGRVKVTLARLGES